METNADNCYYLGNAQVQDSDWMPVLQLFQYCRFTVRVINFLLSNKENASTCKIHRYLPRHTLVQDYYCVPVLCRYFKYMQNNTEDPYHLRHTQVQDYY